MTVTAIKKPTADGEIVKARELMEKLNIDAAKLNVWVRTELNAPAQRAWFTDTGGDSGAGQLAAGGCRRIRSRRFRIDGAGRNTTHSCSV